MKEWMYVPATIGVAVITSFLTGTLTEPSQRVAAGAAGSDDLPRTLSRLETSLSAIEAREQELQQRLAVLELRPTAAPGAGSRREVGGLDGAVARWMERHLDAAGAARPSIEREAEIDRVIDQLLSAGFGGEEEHALWQELRNSGLIDEVILELAAVVDANPNDPDLHFELGFAYLQKSFGENPGPDAMPIVEQANATFDTALELDNHHWGARFGKAISLSLQPAFLGKTGEAIQHFEILRGQQEERTQESQFSQTYYYLGNLYQQMGEPDKALEAWRRGADLFPEDAALLGQLAIQERAEVGR